MKKEILIAIIIGFILGLIITFGIWTANKSLKNGVQNKQKTEENLPTPTPSQNEEGIFLEITSPLNNDIISKEDITIEGQTKPQAVIAIIYQEGEELIQADSQGNFSADITLVGGANEIQISAYDDQNNEAKKTLDLIYSTAKI